MIVNDAEPPPGAGLETMPEILPAVPRRVEGTVKSIAVLETVAWTALPWTDTLVELKKPLPEM